VVTTVTPVANAPTVERNSLPEKVCTERPRRYAAPGAAPMRSRMI